MTYARSLLIALLVCLGLGVAALAQTKNPAPLVPTGDPAMAAAFERARLGLDGFLAKLRQPPAGSEGFSIKVGLVDAPGGAVGVVHPGASDRGFVEYFWIGDLSETASGFEGRIANKPENIRNAVAGARLAFSRADVADWMYFQDGKIVGNATACPALAHASAQEREYMRQQYGLVCP